MAFTAQKYCSFPIAEITKSGDDDLTVVGRCSDGAVDHDGDIVSPAFMASAIKGWLETYPAVRYQHRGDHPAGKGLDAWQDDTGSTWLKALVCDDQAKRMVAKGVLRAWSVGLMNVQTRKSARAPRWEIIGGHLSEVSLVDSPSNARCGIQIIGKSSGGVPEYVGKTFGKKVAKPKVGKAFRRELVAWDLNSGDPAIREAVYREALASPAVTKAAKSGKVSKPGLLAGYLDSSDPWLFNQAYREAARSRGLHF